MSVDQVTNVGGFPAAREREDVRTSKVVAGGAGTETIFGIGAVVLSILGLVKISPAYMLTISCMAIGVAFLSQGMAVADRYDELSEELAKRNLQDERTRVSSGVGSEFAGGLAGIVLGVLALIGLAPAVLIPVASIIYGVTLLLSTTTVSDFQHYAAGFVRGHHGAIDRLSNQALRSASGTQVLVGIGAVVLGILALIGTGTTTLSFVSMLAVGCATVISGAAIGSRMAFALKQ